MNKKPIEPISAAEFARLLAATGSGAVGARDRALLQLLMKSQLRISEALALRKCDYDQIEGTLNVCCGKGGRQRIAVLHFSATEAVSDWLLVKQRRGLPDDPLFCTLTGKPMNRQNVNRSLKRLGRRAGIGKRLHCHLLRHSGARLLASQNVPVSYICAQLGHASLSTTHRYLELLAPVERIKRLSSINW